MVEGGEQLHFLVPCGRLDLSGLENQKISVVGHQQGHLWEQIELPLRVTRMRGQVLLNLCSTAPIWLRNQITSHHDITYIRHKESFSWKFRWTYRTLAPLFLRRSKGIITVSEFSKHEISSIYNIPLEKFTIVPNAVDSRFVETPEQNEDSYFLAVASPNVHKNFGRLVKAYEEYCANGGTTRLVIAGSQPSHFTQDNSLSSQVEYLGRVTDDELIDLYARARAFLFPSLYEGFGIPPLEAQAAGTPVAAASVAAMPEVLQDSVMWFDPHNTSEMTRTMMQIDEDPALRENFRSLGLTNVARFSWKKSASIIVELLRTN
ncbi:glycosyl transferase family protein [Arthrobacter sp. PAMC 25486]|nr:glycosyl transferase family protein [Arthrobacter sp. PAMC 25486]